MWLFGIGGVKGKPRKIPFIQACLYYYLYGIDNDSWNSYNVFAWLCRSSRQMPIDRIRNI